MMETWKLCGLAIVVGLAGCKSETAASGAPSASAQSSAALPTPSSEEEAFQAKYYAPGRYPIATGPKLAILPGEGVGPIRFGANIDTIQRLMELPCEVREENACRYIGRAVEFFLKDGVLSEIRIHRLNRFTTPKPRIYGLFNGRFPSGANLNMFKAAIVELMGPPMKVEQVTDGGENHTVEIDYYDGMRLEYDKLFNGNVVLGGIILTGPASRNPTAAPAPGSATPASGSKASVAASASRPPQIH